MLVEPFYISDHQDCLLIEGRLYVASPPAVLNGRFIGTGAGRRRVISLNYAQVTAKWVTLSGAAKRAQTRKSHSYTKGLYLATWMAQLWQEFGLAAHNEAVELQKTEPTYYANSAAFRNVDAEEVRMKLALKYRLLRALARYWKNVIDDVQERLDIEDTPKTVLKELEKESTLANKSLLRLEIGIKKLFQKNNFPSGQLAAEFGLIDGEVAWAQNAVVIDGKVGHLYPSS
ncbi:hypothetical protein B0H21DRAFT_826601 [Amylocystis lapponica]|nr:hypothetical protein B0H21DRAFT_826601 [Amylocystis lapponica]